MAKKDAATIRAKKRKKKDKRIEKKRREIVNIRETKNLDSPRKLVDGSVSIPSNIVEDSSRTDKYFSHFIDVFFSSN